MTKTKIDVTVKCPSCGHLRTRAYSAQHAQRLATTDCKSLCRPCAARLPRSSQDRYIDQNGYVYIRGEAKNFVAEHRAVLEGMIGRPLAKGESVHHKNGKRDDNRAENLELWVGPARFGQRLKDIVLDYLTQLDGVAYNQFMEEIVRLRADPGAAVEP